MSDIVLRIPGTPTGKGRARFNPRTGHAHTPHQTRVAEARVFHVWQMAGEPRLPEGPASLEAELVLARPGGHFRVNGELSKAGLASRWPTKKPDADNVLKLIMDSLNGCAYKDDAHVVEASVVKRWCTPGEMEHTIVTLRPKATA